MNNRLLLTRCCWRTFMQVIGVARQTRSGEDLPPERVRSRMLAALREGGELAATSPEVERAWTQRIRAMLIYFVDDRLVQLRWNGGRWWLENRLQCAPEGLGRPQAQGGNWFYEDCDALRQEFLEAEHRNQPERELLAEQLGLYYTCLRLGFQGQFDGRPDLLKNYEMGLYAFLPGHSAVRDEELFPQAYQHTEKRKAIYDWGTKLAVVLTIFAFLVVGTVVVYRLAWSSTVDELEKAAKAYAAAPAPVGVDAPGSTPGGQ